MIEKIRLSLWDILTFFLSGFLFVIIATFYAAVLKDFSLEKVINFVFKIPASISLFLLPLAFTLIGMLIEPLANYFDKLISDPIFKKLIGEKKKHKGREKVIEDFIKTKCLGELNSKIDNPFAICKEYVETKQLSTTFMVFLSRYGFYRNASFLCILSIILTLVSYGFNYTSVIISTIQLMLVIAFKKRSEDFYSYQAPSIYYAFLIDKLDWKP